MAVFEDQFQRLHKVDFFFLFGRYGNTLFGVFEADQEQNCCNDCVNSRYDDPALLVAASAHFVDQWKGRSIDDKGTKLCHEHTENIDDRSLSLITAHQGCQCAVRNVDHRVKESGNEVICNRYVNILSDGSGVWNEEYKHTCYGNRYCQP